jgi:hypothetical protein
MVDTSNPRTNKETGLVKFKFEVEKTFHMHSLDGYLILPDSGNITHWID